MRDRIIVYIILLAFLVVGVVFDGLLPFDMSIMEMVSSNITKGWVDFFKLTTNIASTKVIAGLSALILVYFLYKKDKRGLKLICSTVLASAVFNQILKFLIRRPRPVEFMLYEKTSFSFPSGHTMIGLSFYLFIFYYFLKGRENKVVMTIPLLLGVFIAVTRVALGVHWPTDVIAGYLFEILIFSIARERDKKEYEIEE